MPATHFNNALPLTPLASAAQFDQSLCEAFFLYMQDPDISAETAERRLRRFYLCNLHILTRPRISAMNSLCMSTEMRVFDRKMMAYVAALLVAAYIMGVFSTPLATKGWILLNGVLNAISAAATCASAWSDGLIKLWLLATAAVAAALFTAICQQGVAVEGWVDGIEVLRIPWTGWLAGSMLVVQFGVSYYLGRYLQSYPGLTDLVEHEVRDMAKELATAWEIDRSRRLAGSLTA